MASLNGDTKIIVDLINLRINGVEKRIERIDSNLTGKVHDHCDRIKTLEHKSIKAVGIIAGVTFAVSAFWAVLTQF